MAVQVPGRQGARLAAGTFGVLALVGVAQADANVVSDVRVQRDAVTTRIVLELAGVDGAVRYRSRASDDGGAMLVELDDAALDSSVPRLVPVSDRRVDGVLLQDDAGSRVVRVSVDLAGRVRPRFVARVEGARLLLDFVDATAAATPEAAPATLPRRVGPATTVPSHANARPAERMPDARELRLARNRQAAPPVVDPSSRSRQDALDRGAATPAPAPRNVASTGAASPRKSGAAPARSVLERPVVVLDPGHGGKDPGARAWTGEVEKDIVLDLAERVARRLRATGDVEVVMTRSGDEYVELADRRDTSRRWGADAFVSIHANASHNVAARGIETYYHSRTTGDRDMRRLVRAENGGRGPKGLPASSSQPSTGSGLSKASLSRSTPPVLERRSESIRLAKAVQGELVRQLGMRYEAVRDLGAKEGPFFVIGENAAPSVLVEAAFLTHREEGLRMRSEVYREQIADGVARGITQFLEQQRRSGTL